MMTTRSDCGLHCLTVTGRVETEEKMNRRKDAGMIKEREQQMGRHRRSTNDPVGACAPVGVCVEEHSNDNLTAEAGGESLASKSRQQKHACSAATCRAVPAIC